jgi:general secretion pathway protein H
MRSRADGFTLLEVMLVLLVMSLVMAVTYPSMSRGRAAFHLRAVGRDVVNALRFARETAVTQRKVMIVVVDFQSQRVTVSDDVGDGARSFAPPSDVKIQGLTGSGGDLQQGLLRIRYLPNGSSDGAQILLKSDTGASLKIVADPILGAARIVSEQGEKGP